jgi:hypothetical protein
MLLEGNSINPAGMGCLEFILGKYIGPTLLLESFRAFFFVQLSHGTQKQQNFGALCCIGTHPMRGFVRLQRFTTSTAFPASSPHLKTQVQSPLTQLPPAVITFRIRATNSPAATLKIVEAHLAHFNGINCVAALQRLASQLTHQKDMQKSYMKTLKSQSFEALVCKLPFPFVKNKLLTQKPQSFFLRSIFRFVGLRTNCHAQMVEFLPLHCRAWLDFLISTCRRIISCSCMRCLRMLQRPFFKPECACGQL